MAGEIRTCTNCGSQQATGAFCERCGTRLPEPGDVQPAAGAPPAPAPAALQPAAPPYQYAAPAQPMVPRVPGPFSKLFDLSFQGFVTRDSLRLIFTTTLGLLAVYWVFALIFGIVAAVKFQAVWCIGIFSSLILVSLMIIWTRVMMELTMTVSEMREDMEKAVQEATKAAAEAATQKAAAKPTTATTTAAKTTTATKPTAAKTTAAKTTAAKTTAAKTTAAKTTAAKTTAAKTTAAKTTKV